MSLNPQPTAAGPSPKVRMPVTRTNGWRFSAPATRKKVAGLVTLTARLDKLAALDPIDAEVDAVKAQISNRLALRRLKRKTPGKV